MWSRRDGTKLNASKQKILHFQFLDNLQDLFTLAYVINETVAKCVCQTNSSELLTSSEFKDFSYEHEAGFSQRIFPPVDLIAIVRQVAVIVSLLL